MYACRRNERNGPDFFPVPVVRACARGRGWFQEKSDGARTASYFSPATNCTTFGYCRRLHSKFKTCFEEQIIKHVQSCAHRVHFPLILSDFCLAL